MKLKFLKKAATLLSVGILMTGCSADEITPESETPVEKDSQFFINVSIATPTEQTTRDNDNTSPKDYDDGTKDEQKVNEILFIFYNTANKYVGHTVIEYNSTDQKYETSDGEEVKVDTSSVSSDGSIETILNITVPVSVSAGSLKPAYVLAYINPTVEREADEQRSFEQMIGVTRPLDQVIPCDNPAHFHAGFTMTNSVYYDTNDNDWTRPKVAVEIPEGLLFTSKDNATNAANITKKVVIYVERVVAKVTVNKGTTFTQSKNKIKDQNNVEYTLVFDILGWGVSIAEKQTFLVKNFRTSGNVTNFDLPFTFTNNSETQIRDLLDGHLNSPDWNQAPTGNDAFPGYRSFWSFSPTYFTGARYPSYSDQLTYEENLYDEDNPAPSSYVPFSLEYLSFNDIYNTKTSTKGSRGESVGQPLYSLEHTMMADVATRHQKRGVTCALVLGRYNLKRGNEDLGNPTFYIRDGINSSGDNVNYIYPNDATLITAILNANNRLYIKEGDAYKLIPNDDTHKANFIIEHPVREISDGKYTPERNVALQFRDEAAAKNYYLRDANGSYNKIIPDNEGETNYYTEANRALYGLMSGIQKYNSGLAYFAVPIKHLWSSKGESEIGDDGFKAVLGQYGVVRNHIYTINVNGLEGIGTGIGDPENPIIPNVEEEKYYVNTQLNIQRWRIVPTQNVFLKP